MSTAIIQGATGGLGAPLTRLLLQRSRLNVVALTSKPSAAEVRDSLLSGLNGKGGPDVEKRLHVIPRVDVCEETTVERAAREVKERYRSASVRLIVCLAGELHPEKSLSQVSPSAFLHSFQLNTLGHLLVYKHFVPLIPSRREFHHLIESWRTGEGDPAQKLVNPKNATCMSLSARVGSITQNGKGGWYSYRASKAALNQIVRTLDHELMNKKSSAVAFSYHPGTTLTSFTRPIIGTPKPDPRNGLFEPAEAVEKMLRVISMAGRETGPSGQVVGPGWGGGFRDWKADKVPF